MSMLQKRMELALGITVASGEKVTPSELERFKQEEKQKRMESTFGKLGYYVTSHGRPKQVSPGLPLARGELELRAIKPGVEVVVTPTMEVIARGRSDRHQNLMLRIGGTEGIQVSPGFAPEIQRAGEERARILQEKIIEPVAELPPEKIIELPPEKIIEPVAELPPEKIIELPPEKIIEPVAELPPEKIIELPPEKIIEPGYWDKASDWWDQASDWSATQMQKLLPAIDEDYYTEAQKRFVETKLKLTGKSPTKIEQEISTALTRISGGAYKYVREKPLSVARTAATFYVLPYILGAAGSIGVVAKVAKIPGVKQTVGLGLAGWYGTGIYTRIKAEPTKELKYEQVGAIGIGEIVPMMLGAKLGTKHYQQLSGWVRTRGLKEILPSKIIEPEVLTGKKLFPTSPKEHLKLFKESKYQLPPALKTKKELGVWHAATTAKETAFTKIIQKTGLTKVAEVGVGKEYLPGGFVSPSLSPFFLKLGTKPYKMFGWDLFPGTPTVAYIIPKGVKAYKGRTAKDMWKFLMRDAKKGYAYTHPSSLKQEVEAIMTPSSPIKGISKRFFVRWEKTRVPILEYTAKLGEGGRISKGLTVAGVSTSYVRPSIISPATLGVAAAVSYKSTSPKYVAPYIPYEPALYEPPKYVEPYKPYKPPKYVEPYKPYKPPKYVEPYKPYKPPKYVEPYKPYKPPKYVEPYKPYKPPKYVEPYKPYKPPKYAPLLLRYPTYKAQRYISPVTPKPYWWSKGEEGLPWKRKKLLVAKRPAKYRPSLVAIARRIYTTKPEKLMLTGLGIRPIPIRWS